MTRRDWWFGIAVLAAAITLHALIPRYAWPNGPTVRYDRWTGQVDQMRAYQGRYYPETQLTPAYDFSGIAKAK